MVGSHQRSGLQRLVLGSVAKRVLHDSHCPALRVVPKDYGETVPSPRIEPACPDCVAVRARSANAQFWCERHSKPYLAATHLRAARRSAVVDDAGDVERRFDLCAYASIAVTPSVIRLFAVADLREVHAHAAQQR